MPVLDHSTWKRSRFQNAQRVAWLDAETMAWSIEPTAVDYHVYRGELTQLGYGFFGLCRDDLDPVVTDTVLTDAGLPATGTSWFYLITAENAAGDEGSLGVGTAAERSNFAACP